MEYVQSLLFKMQDLEYKNFHSRLISTVNPDIIIGVRVPMLRKLANDFYNDEKAKEFLSILPHKYYEEYCLHAFLIEKIKNYQELICEVEKFLPYIDNWAVCDMFKPKIFAKHTDELVFKIFEWLESDKTYTVRYAVGLLMNYYLDYNFKEEYMKKIAQIRSDEYYINMMIAWYFATALVKQYDAAIKYLLQGKLSVWAHNKAIQKACESLRITNETKEYLKTLKIK